MNSTDNHALLDNKRILIIEDEFDIAELIALHLRNTFSDVHVEHNGNEGLQQALNEPWDMYILDIRLPGVDGLEICKSIRAHNINTPILMLTSRSSELDRVLGLELGADDYVTKPFSVIELTARVKAIFRRIKQLTADNDTEKNRVINHGPLHIDLNKRLVTIHEESINLTSKEFDLLCCFAAEPGTVFSRSDLLTKVWGNAYQGYEHTVNSHINRLRNKLQSHLNAGCITTVWGVGYKLNDTI
ncbi:MAG: response regulator transcription factor [Pseudomonadota bacterium]